MSDSINDFYFSLWFHNKVHVSTIQPVQSEVPSLSTQLVGHEEEKKKNRKEIVVVQAISFRAMHAPELCLAYSLASNNPPP